MTTLPAWLNVRDRQVIRFRVLIVTMLPSASMVQLTVSFNPALQRTSLVSDRLNCKSPFGNTPNSYCPDGEDITSPVYIVVFDLSTMVACKTLDVGFEDGPCDGVLLGF